MTDAPTADELFRLSDAAWWAGRLQESLDTCAAAHEAFLTAGDTRRAATAAMELAGLHFMRGDEVRGSAWFGKAGRLLEHDVDCVEHGYLRYFCEVEPALEGADPDHLVTVAGEVREIGRRHGDLGLVALTTMCEGRGLVIAGRVAEGLALLDEAMAAVLDEGVRPDWAGNIYCNMIDTCHELADLRRMRSWTESLEQWCASLPAAVMFTGICRIHRAQLLQTRGDWARSEAEAAQVCEDLQDMSVANAAEAHYVVGDARRLRGDLAGAESAYLRAHEGGRDPQPGIALLRLAQGRPGVALKSVHAALTAENRGPLARTRLCAAAVEIAVAAGAVDIARKAADELEDVAQQYSSPGLSAMADEARGAVALAEDRPDEALPILRRACAAWRELDAPYDCSRVRRLLARVYAALGDLDASEREQAAADAALAGMKSSAPRPNGTLPDGLTAREVEVLTLVAVGKSNRAVAADLVLSEKTVARHLSNIFTKLGLSSRTAAAAYAFDHGLATSAGG